LKTVRAYILIALLLLPCLANGFTNTLRDTLPTIWDSLITDVDTIAVKSDSLPKRSGSLDAPVFSTGRDSTIYDFTGTERLIYYYGDVVVTYDDLEIKSEYMVYNIDTRIVHATGVRDSTGNWIGSPVMKEGGKEYRMEGLDYNFTSKKAIIKNVITTEGEAYLHGKVIKKMPDNSINIKDGRYTTCDAEHPHFYLSLSKAKVTAEPNSQTVFGPAYLVIEDVPTPLLLPFGFIPKRTDRSGGFLFPTFGDEYSRGFAVRNIGWYFVLGEYFDLALTGDYYTLGSWALRAKSRYKKNYKFDGNLDLDFSETVLGDRGSTDYSSFRDFSIRWQHRQDLKANPGMRFSAMVNFKTTSFLQNNSQNNPMDALQSQAQSSINFSRNWEGTPFNLSVSLTHSQNMRDSSYALGLPNFTFSMNTIYPFKRKRAVGKERFYEKFSIGYSTSFNNKIRFKESEWGDPDFWKKLENGMEHKFKIGLPSFSIFKHINISPSINYDMNWYFQGLQKAYNDTTNRVEDVKSNSFSEFHVTNNYSFSIGASTSLYGTFMYGKNAYIQAIRHKFSPSISASYSPDMRVASNGYRTYNYIDTEGIARSVEYNAFTGVYSPPSSGRSASMSLSLNNNLEMKVLSKKDTLNGGVKKVKLIDNLSIGSSYNFLADSLNLSNISVSMSTSLFGKVGVSANATFDPYAQHNGRKINTFAISDGQGLVRLLGASFSFGHQFSGGENGFKNNPKTLEGVPRYDPETGNYLYTEYLYYSDFKAPWTFGFNYAFNYTPTYEQNSTGEWVKKHKYMQTLSFNGSIKLTEAFDFRFNSGFDFQSMKMTSTQLNIQYDLHCYQFSVGWVPFGRFSSWSFNFSAKSAMLSDLLKYDKGSRYYAY